MLLRLGTLALLAYTSHGFVMSLGCGPSEGALSRREAISKVSLAGDESNQPCDVATETPVFSQAYPGLAESIVIIICSWVMTAS